MGGVPWWGRVPCWGVPLGGTLLWAYPARWYSARGVPCPGGVPCWGVPCWGGYPVGGTLLSGTLLGGTLLGGTLPVGYPARGVTCWGGNLWGSTLLGGVPCPPVGGSYLCGVQAANELSCCELCLYSPLPNGIMGNVAKHHGSLKKKKNWVPRPTVDRQTYGWMDGRMDRHVSKHYLPVILRTRAVIKKIIQNI